jgi:hypothetical protein
LTDHSLESGQETHQNKQQIHEIGAASVDRPQAEIFSDFQFKSKFNEKINYKMKFLTNFEVRNY